MTRSGTARRPGIPGTITPDDILSYLSTSAEVARAAYITDLESHVMSAMREACPDIMDFLTSDLALDIFVPASWTGIRGTTTFPTLIYFLVKSYL